MTFTFLTKGGGGKGRRKDKAAGANKTLLWAELEKRQPHVVLAAQPGFSLREAPALDPGQAPQPLHISVSPSVKRR